MERQRILVADDDENIRLLLRRQITRSFPGVTIVEAVDGQSALDQFDQEGADIIIVDHRMPRMDGSAMVHSLRLRQVKIPIIVISGHKQARQEALNAGASLFLEKGDALQQLPQVLAAFLPQPDSP